MVDARVFLFHSRVFIYGPVWRCALHMHQPRMYLSFVLFCLFPLSLSSVHKFWRNGGEIGRPHYDDGCVEDCRTGIGFGLPAKATALPKGSRIDT